MRTPEDIMKAASTGVTDNDDYGFSVRPSRPTSLTHAELLAQIMGVPEVDSLTPEEEKGWIDDLKAGSVGALSAVGNVLDVPGSMVRDTLAGENPFDQALPWNWTSHKGRVTGRELLELYGMQANKETGISGWLSDPMEGVRDIAGFGAEIATDPLSYMTLGAVPFLGKGKATLTKAGEALDKADLLDYAEGVLKRSEMAAGKGPREIGVREARSRVTPRMMAEDPELKRLLGDELSESIRKMPAELLDEKLGGGLKVGAPFGDSGTIFSPTGGRVSRSVDSFDRWISRTAPGRAVSGLFDYASRGNYGVVGQQIARMATGLKDRGAKRVAESYAELNLSVNAARNFLDPLMSKDMLEAVGRRGKIIDAAVGGRQVKIGDFLKDPVTGQISRVIDYSEKTSKLSLRSFNKKSGEYTVSQRLKSQVEEFNKDFDPGDLGRQAGDAGIVEDGLEKTLMSLMRALKERGVDNFESTLKELKVKDVFADVGDSRNIYQLMEERANEIGLGSNPVMLEAEKVFGEVVSNTEKLERSFRSRMLKKGYDIKDIEKMDFFYAARSVTPTIKDFIEEEGRRLVKAGRLKPEEVQSFADRSLKDMELEIAGIDPSAAAAMGRDPAISHLPVYVIERILNDKYLNLSDDAIEELAKTKGWAPGGSLDATAYLSQANITFGAEKIQKVYNTTENPHLDVAVGKREMKVSLGHNRKRAVKHGLAKNEYDKDFIREVVPEYGAEFTEGSDDFAAVIESGLTRENKSVVPVVDENGMQLIRDNRGVYEIRSDLTPEELIELVSKKRIDDISEEISSFHGKYSEQVGPGRTSMYATDFLMSYKNYFAQLNSAEAIHDATLSFLADDLRKSFVSRAAQKAAEEAPTGKQVSLQELLVQLGHKQDKLTGHDIFETIPSTEISGATMQAEVMKPSRLDGFKEGETFTSRFDEGNKAGLRRPKNSLETLGQMLGREFGEEHNLLTDALEPVLDWRKLADDEVTVSQELADALLGVKQFTQRGPMMDSFLKFVDSFTQMFKGNVTLPFPSFATRNFASGQFVNVTSGDVKTLADLNQYKQAFTRARDIGRNPGEHAKIIQEIRAMDIVGNKHLDDVDYVGNWNTAYVGRPSREVTPGKMEATVLGKDWWRRNIDDAKEYVDANPELGRDMIGQKSRLEKTVKKYFDPKDPSLTITKKEALKRNLKLKDLKETFEEVAIEPTLPRTRKIHRSVLSAGSHFNQIVEWQNRVPLYLYLREKGYSAAAAADRVRSLQFDYGRLTRFEKEAMRRVIPFYAFTRNMAPLFFETLLTRPGGAMSQTIRATRIGTDSSEILPHHVQSRTAIPLGSSDDPSQPRSFITGLGLAHEDPLSYFQTLGGGPVSALRGAAMQGLSRMNPLLKYPLEMATGSSFYQVDQSGKGKQLEDLSPQLGQLLANLRQRVTGEEQFRTPDPVGGYWFENLVSNTPLSRGLGVASRALDPRDPWSKLPSFFLGPKVTTLSPYQLRKARSDALKELLRQQGTGGEMEIPYIDKQRLAEEVQRDRINTTELSAMPDRYRIAALAAMEEKRIREMGKESRATRRREKMARLSNPYGE